MEKSYRKEATKAERYNGGTWDNLVCIQKTSGIFTSLKNVG